MNTRILHKSRINLFLLYERRVTANGMGKFVSMLEVVQLFIGPAEYLTASFLYFLTP